MSVLHCPGVTYAAIDALSECRPDLRVDHGFSEADAAEARADAAARTAAKQAAEVARVEAEAAEGRDADGTNTSD